MYLKHADFTLTKEQSTVVYDGGKLIVLTPDDILTLKLLRDDFLKARFMHKEDPDRPIGYYSARNRCVETLERILKQVG